jgi:hypothetical protein
LIFNKSFVFPFNYSNLCLFRLYIAQQPLMVLLNAGTGI